MQKWTYHVIAHHGCITTTVDGDDIEAEHDAEFYAAPEVDARTIDLERDIAVYENARIAWLATDKAKDGRIEKLQKLLDKLAYPARFPESGHSSWHSGDGPFEDWAEQISKEYRELMVSVPK